MDWRTMIIFLATFAVGYAAISLIDSSSIYWVGLVGGVIGALLAFLVVSYLRRDTTTDTDRQ